jgi:hypothetical protein
MAETVYKNPDVLIEDRVKDLLERMTLEEKILQLTSIWLHFNSEKGEMAPTSFGGQRTDLDIDYFLNIGIGQITRPFGSQPIDPVKGADMVNRLQKRLMRDTRLGYPGHLS